MSSSRSIAAARNRRSGDSSISTQPSRPNKSIGGQAAFAPQQQQTRRPGQQQVQQQVQPQIHQSQNPVPITKLTVSDAIGLVTLRLGRLEQFMFDVQAGAIETNTNELPENSHVFDKSVIASVINRLDSLEKREQGHANNNTLVTQITKLEKEIKDVKEILLTHIMKYEKFVIENDKKLLEIDSTFDEFEKKLESNDEEQLSNSDANTEEVVLEETYPENNLENNFESNEINELTVNNNESQKSNDLKQHIKNSVNVNLNA